MFTYSREDDPGGDKADPDLIEGEDHIVYYLLAFYKVAVSLSVLSNCPDTSLNELTCKGDWYYLLEAELLVVIFRETIHLYVELAFMVF